MIYKYTRRRLLLLLLTVTVLQLQLTVPIGAIFSAKLPLVNASTMTRRLRLAVSQLSGRSTVNGSRDCAESIFNWSLKPSPEAHLRTPKLIERHGYRVETHYVISEDGYVLTLFRIPHGKTKKRAKSKAKGSKTSKVKTKSTHKPPRKPKPVVLLQHGVICTSSDWLMNTEDKLLPYILANAGYDVWLGNARGTTYSDRHVSLTSRDLDYWKFSWHEMGAYDIPATIDYILAKTREPKLYYIGHSMGTTAFLVAMSMRPEYNAKIRSMYALAPVAYVENMICPLSLLAPFAKGAEKLFDVVNNGRFLPKGIMKIVNGLGPIVCAASPLAMVGCGIIFFAVSGFDPCQVNTTEQMSNIAGHTPDTTSSRTILHYLQLKMMRNSFRQYDYGPAENWVRYRHLTPPAYNLSKVTAKVAVFWGQNDFVSVPKDVQRLVDQLPNVIAYHRVDFDLWSHLDFTYGVDVKPLVYDYVLRLMKYHYN